MWMTSVTERHHICITQPAGMFISHLQHLSPDVKPNMRFCSIHQNTGRTEETDDKNDVVFLIPTQRFSERFPRKKQT